MEKIIIDPKAGSPAMQKKAIPFDTVKIIPNSGRRDLPADETFQKSGHEMSGRSLLFDLSAEVRETQSALLRFAFTIPEEGDYLYGIGADWWHISWIDGNVILDRDSSGNGGSPTKFDNHRKTVHLSAGKHTLDVRFTRGAAGADLAVCIAPKSVEQELAAEIRESVKQRKYVLDPFYAKRDYMNDRIKSGIEANRKGNLFFTIVDEKGTPVSHAHVKIRQKTHDFKYGANLFMLEEFSKPEQNEAYKKYFADAFNLATLPFYWSDLEPEQGKPRFAKDSPKIYRRPAPDLCLEYCEAHGIEPKAHCLNYAHFSPNWAKGSVDWEKQCLRKRFEALAERYAERIPMWEVTNETYWGANDHDLNFYQQPDFVEWSFKEAERCFPANKLVINEMTSFAWSIFYRNRSPYYMQIERALLKGARIDEIGMQYHMFFRREGERQQTAQYYDPQRIYDVLDTYAELGKPIHVTELTVPAYSNDPLDEELQAEILRNLYSMWFSHRAMTGIIYWNLIDGFAAFAPQGDMTAGENYYYGGLLRYDFTPKPAYNVIRDLFQKEWHTELELDLDGSDSTQFRGFYGKYDLEITANGKTVTKEVHLGRERSSRVTVTI